jgi:hypothetical protein
VSEISASFTSRSEPVEDPEPAEGPELVEDPEPVEGPRVSKWEGGIRSNSPPEGRPLKSIATASPRRKSVSPELVDDPEPVEGPKGEPDGRVPDHSENPARKSARIIFLNSPN